MTSLKSLTLSMVAVAMLMLSAVGQLMGQQRPEEPPPGGQALLPDLAQSISRRNYSNGSVESVEVEGPGFTRALRYTTTKAGHDYELNTSTPVPHEFKKGEAVLISFWARTVSTRRETGQGLVQVHLSEGQSPWRQEAGRFVSFSDQWQRFYAPGVLSRDYPANHMHLKVFAGNVEQVIEIGGIELLSYGVGFDVNLLPKSLSSYEGMEENAAWRKLAEQRIQEVRTAPLVIEVIGGDARPVADAVVKAQLVRHAFEFGTAVNPNGLVRPTEKSHEIRRQKMLELFNSGTFYNHLKWPAWVGAWGDFHSREITMEGLKWFRDNGLAFRGHVLIWPSYRNLPSFMRKVADDPEAIRKLCLAHIDEIAAATSEYVQEWDVVNEPYDNHNLMDICGNEVMVEWFKRAAERLPGVRLALNDYSLLTPLADTRKQAAFEETVKMLLDAGAPLHVLGLQGHFGGTLPSPERIYATLDRFAKLGLPLRVTEYDIGSDEAELKYAFTRDLLMTVYSHPAVIGWQTWGISNIVKEDGSFTPEGQAFYELVHQKWKTAVELATDAQGRVEARGHLGRYRVEISKGDRQATFFIDLRKDAAPSILTLP